LREVVAEQVPNGERDQRAAISGRRKQRDRYKQSRDRRDECCRTPRFE
jgi:hypothetical protein